MTAKIKKEYKKLKERLAGAEENRLLLFDDLILEAARTKLQLDELNKIVEESGFVIVNEEDIRLQKPTAAGKELIKLRACYAHMISALNKLFNREDDEDEGGLEDYE